MDMEPPSPIVEMDEEGEGEREPTAEDYSWMQGISQVCREFLYGFELPPFLRNSIFTK